MSDLHDPEAQAAAYAAMRREYLSHGLDESDVDPDPIEQFHRWFDEAVKGGLPEANAFTFSTATPDGKPSSRVLLMKGFSFDGLTFYTNYLSRKAEELEANPHAAMLFFWSGFERQVRVEGTVSRVSREDTQAYFDQRPRDSRLGAWASPQSRELAGRHELEAAFAAARERFGDEGPVPAPDHWGGYRLQPTAWEFWQGRPNRLHDRIAYRLKDDGSWRIVRLSA